MRILHVIHSMDRRSGGPSASLRSLAAAQLRFGHVVHIVCSDAQSADPWAPARVFIDSLTHEQELAGVRVTVLEGMGRRPPLNRFRYVPGVRERLQEILQDEDDAPQVVHIHGLFSHLTMAAAQEARAAGLPYIVRPAGGLNSVCLRGGRSLLKRLVYTVMERNNLAAASSIHATSDRERREIQTLLPGAKIFVAPHGTDVPPADGTVYAREVFLRRFPVLRDHRMVLYLSRLAPKKRLDLLIRAFAALAPEMPDLVLVIAGSDAGARRPAQALVKKLGVKDRVHFLGFVTGMVKEGAFADAELLVLPSKDENFGLVVAEAMAHGLPVVVSEGVDSHVYVKEAHCGVVVRSSVGSIREGIRTVLSKDRTLIGERGRRYVLAKLSWDRVVHRLDECYLNAIKAAQTS